VRKYIKGKIECVVSSMRIAIIVNSCFAFYKIAVPILIKSAYNAGIPLQDIYVVVGDSDETVDMKCDEIDDYNIAFCKYINIDFNGVIYFTQTEVGLGILEKYTHFFYIHDTAEFLPHFWENIQKYAYSCSSYISLQPYGSKNIGLFSVPWFLENKKDLLSHFINYDISKKLQYKQGLLENESVIRNNFQHLPGGRLNEDILVEMNPNAANFFPQQNIKCFFEPKYSDVMRKATMYPEPGIIKYQSNWGQPQPNDHYYMYI